MTPDKAAKFALTESDLVPKRFITLTFTEQLGEINVCFAMKTLNPSKDFFPFGKINASIRRYGSSSKLYIEIITQLLRKSIKTIMISSELQKMATRWSTESGLFSVGFIFLSVLMN